MIRTYSYELWDGKKVVGHYNSISQMRGKVLLVPEVSMFKQPYGTKERIIEVPVLVREVANDGVDVTFRICLDVRRKSKRQIEIITKGSF